MVANWVIVLSFVLVFDTLAHSCVVPLHFGCVATVRRLPRRIQAFLEAETLTTISTILNELVDYT